METPVTLFQLVAAVILTLVASLSPQFYNIYARYRDSKDKAKAQELEKQKTDNEQENSAVQHWERVAGEYARQIESLRRLETEVAELRPLVLKNALLGQENSQIKEDKEDWKAYATRLSDQLQEQNIIPLPFRRTPHDGDTQEKLKTISRKMKTVKEGSEKDRSASLDSPTLVFPPTKGDTT